MIVRAVVFAVLIVATAKTTVAQPKQPLARFAVDLRAASAALPIAEGWTPPVPDGTVVPSRALGLEAGAHVFVGQFRWGALGVGASWLLARGATSPTAADEDTTASPTLTIPDVTTRLSSLVPQLSLNFGHSLGWSYLSAGYGLTNVRSERAATRATLAAPAVALESGWTRTINVGGGARWLITDHVGVGFDLRWHMVALPAERTFAGRATLLTAGAGLVLK
jgi:hypothetical protein